MVIMIVVVVWVVIIYIKKEWNLCKFCFLIHTPKKKSQYIIVGSLLVLPTYPTNYFF